MRIAHSGHRRISSTKRADLKLDRACVFCFHAPINAPLRPITLMNKASRHIEFLNHLSVRDLGNGCPIAGAETLINICAALAGISYPESCLTISETGQKFSIGCNILTTSPLSVGSVADAVLAPIWDLQARHFDNTASRAAMRLESEPAKIGVPSKWKESPTYATGEASPMPDDQYSDPRDTRWLTERSPSQHRAEASRRPAIIFDGRDPKLLSRQLQSCHVHKPLLALKITDPRGVAESDSIYQAVTHGVALEGDLPRLVKGNILATTTIPIFNELLQDRPNCHGILEASLWLTGTPLGESLSGKEPNPQKPSLQSRFLTALEGLVAERLMGRPTILNLSPGTAASCYRVAEYLQTLDARLPGISGSLRNLMPTLIFGFSVLWGNFRVYNPQAISNQDETLSSLARALALRMVEYRENLLRTERMERLHRIGTSILGKLEDGPQSPRQLTRRFDCLPIADCREALELLAHARAVAIKDGDQWHLVSRPPSVTTIELNPQS